MSDLFVTTEMCEGEMLVLELCGEDIENKYTPTDSRNRALGIIRASAYAESEGAVFESIAGKGKGFGLSQKDLRLATKFLQLVREQREPLPPGINAIFGFNTKKPLVDLIFADRTISLSVDDARTHALRLLEASEAATTDQFLFFLVDGDKEMWSETITALRLFRQQFNLESLLEDE